MSTSNNFPPSIIEQAIWIIKSLKIDPDKLTPHEYGRIVSNLAMCRFNCVDRNPQKWEDFIDHLMYPDETQIPEGLFMISPEENTHYKLALSALDDIYNKYGE